MSNVTLSVVVPSVDIIFEDDTAAVITAVDADTVLGVTPGVTGLLLLATATAADALSVIGAATPSQIDGVSREVVAAHAMGADPHQVYAKKTDVGTILDADSAARKVLSSHAMAADPHGLTYVKLTDLPSVAEQVGASRANVAAHAMHPDPHRGYVKPSDLVSLIDPTSQARAVLSSHAMAANPHPQYPTMDQMQLADSDTANLIMAHATSRSSHPDRPTLDQAVLFSSFFGG